jgi:hypothetical protein
MSKIARNALIGVGIVAVLAVAAVVFVIRPGSLGSSQVKIVEFIQQNYPVVVDGTDVRESPVATSSSIAKLRQGVAVNVIGVLDGNDWLQIELPDKRLGYVTVSSIPAIRTLPGSGTTQTSGATPAVNAPLEFVSDDELFRVAKPTKAFLAPTSTAPTFYSLNVGTRVQSAAKSKNTAWTVVMTEDGRTAFLQTADLVVMTPAGIGDGLSETVSGPAKAIDTATLVVNDQTLYLFGVKRATGIYVSQMQGLIDSKGQNVDCHRHGEDYICMLSGGLDIARTSLYNGGSKINDFASDDYRQQEAHARSAKLGVWK